VERYINELLDRWVGRDLFLPQVPRTSITGSCQFPRTRLVGNWVNRLGEESWGTY
jgi:hypothetical protein